MKVRGQPRDSATLARMRSPHVLVVDDDRELRELLADYLGRHGCRVGAAADGRAMRRYLEAARVDLVVLDVMLPGEDGLSLCRGLRAGSTLPVIMLSALDEESDRVVGLEMGADDYVVKPFSPRELLARIKAVLRRAVPGEVGDTGAGAHRFDGWRLDGPRRELHDPDGVLMPLTGGEFDLLLAFVEHPQRVLSRERLLDLARGRAAAAFDRSIDVQVSRLRRKLQSDPGQPSPIRTVRGDGYLFAPSVTRG